MRTNMWDKIAKEYGVEQGEEFYWVLGSRKFTCVIQGGRGLSIDACDLRPEDDLTKLIGRFVSGEGSIEVIKVGIKKGMEFYTATPFADFLGIRYSPYGLVALERWSESLFNKAMFVSGLVCTTEEEATKKALLLKRTMNRYIREGVGSIINWEELEREEELLLKRRELEVDPNNEMYYRPIAKSKE